MKRTVGERLSPRPISIGESVLSQNVDHYDPCDDQQCPLDTVLGECQNHGWCYRQRQADPGYEAQKKVKMPHQRKVNPENEHQDDHTRPGNEVDYGPQPELAHHVPTEDGQPGDLRMFGPALERRRFIMAGPSASKNSTIIRIKNRLLRKSATERTVPMAPVMALGSARSARRPSKFPDCWPGS